MVVLVLTLVLNVFGETILGMLPNTRGSFWAFLTEVVDLRFLLMLLLQTGLFTAMFIALPNGKNSFSDSFPGGLMASLGWLLFSKLFSVYVRYSAGYANIYGSVYAVALSMLWLYFCLCLLFCGGALNKLLMEKETG